MTESIKGQEIQLPPLPCELHKSKFWDEGIEWNVAGERALRKERQVQLLAALRDVEALKASLHSLRWVEICDGCEMPQLLEKVVVWRGDRWEEMRYIYEARYPLGRGSEAWRRILPPTAEQTAREVKCGYECRDDLSLVCDLVRGHHQEYHRCGMTDFLTSAPVAPETKEEGR